MRGTLGLPSSPGIASAAASSQSATTIRPDGLGVPVGNAIPADAPLGPPAKRLGGHGDIRPALHKARGAAIDRGDEPTSRRNPGAADAERARGRGERAADDAVAALAQFRRQRVRSLLRSHRDLIEADSAGQPIVRGEILALNPTPAALSRAQRAGFQIHMDETLPGLGIRSVVLVGPGSLSAVKALRRLQALDPEGQYDLNHLYQESGAISARRPPAEQALTASVAPGHVVRIGLIDGGVAHMQPVLGGARIVERGFAAGGPQPSAHGTAVASLLAGQAGHFRGAAPGATLYVADVYGTTPTGGSAEAIAHALGWIAQEGAPVINISLVGPPNLLLETAVKSLIGRGYLIVAAVGNDGPAAPPLFPAAYPGVVAVTGVDPQSRILPEAGRGTHVDLAAPGSEMAAASMDGGFVSVRGTSFAAPLAAGLLARRMAAPGRKAAASALASLGRNALDLGTPGPDPIYGRGLVALDLRVAPTDVQARLAIHDR